MKSELLIFLLLCVTSFGAIYTVDDDGPSDFNSIQEAINYSWDGDTVLVKTGIYNENIIFNGRAITVTSENPQDSNIVENTKILPTTGDAVRFDFGEQADSVITGFTITATGNGIYCHAASPTISYNSILNCSDEGVNGAYSAEPNINNNTILNNQDAGISYCNGIISNNKIQNNLRGIYYCDGLIKENIVKDNFSTGLSSSDGAIFNNIIAGNRDGLNSCNGMIFNNTIIGNLEDGVYFCYATVKNNIIAWNNDYGISGSASINTYNCFWSNNSGNFTNGATPGIGDFWRDPFFAVDGYWDNTTWIDGDYHIKSSAGRYDPNSQTFVLDDVNSPCIDAGDPCEPVGNELNPNGGRINIGAYGGTVEASKSPLGIIVPVCIEYPAMDFNKDCKVDFVDFSIFCLQWLDCNIDPPSACWQ